MIAIGNGEPCPFCKPKKDEVFISKADNNILEHIVKKHPEMFDRFIAGSENIGI